MAATELKPPPRFVKNEWAWAYTLRKLEEKGMVDEHGNPSNYAAANRIYQNVVKKYGAAEPDLPTAADRARNVLGEELDRAQLIDMDTGGWIFSRGVLWAASDERHQRMYFQRTARASNTGRPAPNVIIEPLCLWRVEVHHDDGQFTKGIPDKTALWLVRESAAGERFVREEMRLTLAYLQEKRADLEGDHAKALEGEDPFVTVGQPGTGRNRGVQVVKASELDFGTTLSTFSQHIAEMERALGETATSIRR